MALTYLLAQAIGLYCLVIGISMLTRKSAWASFISTVSRDQTAMFTIGMVALPFGILMVLSHEYWSDGILALLVTLFGWVVALKSGMAMFMTPQQAAKLVKMSRINEWWLGYACIVIILGAYLLLAGFGSA